MTLIRALLRPKVIFLGFLAPACAVAEPTAIQIAEKSRTMERLAPQRYGALPCRFAEIREELNEKGMVEERETETRRIQAATAPDPGSRESQKITPDMHKQNSAEDSSILDHVEIFEWELEAEDESQGEPCYRLAFRPQRGEKVLSGRGEVIARSAGRCWVAKSDFSKRRLEGRLTQPVEMMGFLVTVREVDFLSTTQRLPQGFVAPETIRYRYWVEVFPVFEFHERRTQKFDFGGTTETSRASQPDRVP